MNVDASCACRATQPSWYGAFFFLWCCLQCGRLALDASSKVTPAEADGEHSGGRRTSFVTGGSWLSLFLDSVYHALLDKSSYVAMIFGLLTIFSISACMKVSDRVQELKLWLSFYSRTPWEIISVTGLSTIEEEEPLLKSVAAQYPAVMTSI